MIHRGTRTPPAKKPRLPMGLFSPVISILYFYFLVTIALLIDLSARSSSNPFTIALLVSSSSLVVPLLSRTSIPRPDSRTPSLSCPHHRFHHHFSPTLIPVLVKSLMSSPSLPSPPLQTQAVETSFNGKPQQTPSNTMRGCMSPRPQSSIVAVHLEYASNPSGAQSVSAFIATLQTPTMPPAALCCPQQT